MTTEVKVNVKLYTAKAPGCVECFSDRFMGMLGTNLKVLSSKRIFGKFLL